MWQMIGMMAEYEHSLISERTRAGVKDAKETGGEIREEEEANPGADRTQGPLADRGRANGVEEVAALWKMGRTTLYRTLAR